MFLQIGNEPQNDEVITKNLMRFKKTFYYNVQTFKFLLKINTAECDKFFRNTPRNMIWNNSDCILYNVVRRAFATRLDLAQGSHQATYTQKKHYSIQQKLTLSSGLECTPRLHSKILCEVSRCSI